MILSLASTTLRGLCGNNAHEHLEYNVSEPLSYGTAICYSGYRDGQAPGAVLPSYDEVKEDLLLLEGRWQYLRLYDCDDHSRTVLDVIRREKLHFRVLLGAYINAEQNNGGCPWGGTYPDEVLAANAVSNDAKMQQLIKMANEYRDIVAALSVGNEACVNWTDHLVSPERVASFVRTVKAGVSQPVTFCDNYVPWTDVLAPVAEEVDFISIHSYPQWEGKTPEEAIAYTEQNYRQVADRYPGKQVVITEAGWATGSNGRGIPPQWANVEAQTDHLAKLSEWSRQHHVVIFVFEAFDEKWKGSSDPMEPEKHWGLFDSHRNPKSGR